MSAYLNAPREGSTREDLLAQLELHIAQNKELCVQLAKAIGALRPVHVVAENMKMKQAKGFAESKRQCFSSAWVKDAAEIYKELMGE